MTNKIFATPAALIAGALLLTGCGASNNGSGTGAGAGASDAPKAGAED